MEGEKRIGEQEKERQGDKRRGGNRENIGGLVVMEMVLATLVRNHLGGNSDYIYNSIFKYVIMIDIMVILKMAVKTIIILIIIIITTIYLYDCYSGDQ